MNKIIWAEIIISAFLVLGFSSTVNAQVRNDKAGFAVSPPSFDLNANPGDTIKNTIR